MTKFFKIKFLMALSGLVPLTAFSALDHFCFSFQTKKNKFSRTIEARPTFLGDYDNFKNLYGNATAMKLYMEGVPRPDTDLYRRLKIETTLSAAGSPWTVWLFFDQETKNLLGLVRFEPSDRSESDSDLVEGDQKGVKILPKNEIEVSYVLNPAIWNQGLGSKFVHEMLKNALQWNKQGKLVQSLEDEKYYPVETVYATARGDNPGSFKVLEHNSFKLQYVKSKFEYDRLFYGLDLKSFNPEGPFASVLPKIDSVRFQYHVAGQLTQFEFRPLVIGDYHHFQKFSSASLDETFSQFRECSEKSYETPWRSWLCFDEKHQLCALFSFEILDQSFMVKNLNVRNSIAVLNCKFNKEWAGDEEASAFFIDTMLEKALGWREQYGIKFSPCEVCFVNGVYIYASLQQDAKLNSILQKSKTLKLVANKSDDFVYGGVNFLGFGCKQPGKESINPLISPLNTSGVMAE